MRRAILAGALALMALPAMAEGWKGFYVPKPRPVEVARATGPEVSPLLNTPAPMIVAGAEDGACIREILAAQERHDIPQNLLLAIGLQEAGTRRNGRFTVWPHAVNAAGEGRMFDTRGAAMAWVAERQAAGVRSIDVGCMQINLRWHPEAFASVAEGFDPRANVDYAARFLKRLHKRTGNWLSAAGAYHSFEPEFRDVYLARLKQNIRAANGRLEEFVQIAAAAGPGTRYGAGQGAPSTSPRPGRQAEAPRVVDVAWGSGLGGARGARKSLYSAQELQPILPAFRQGGQG